LAVTPNHERWIRERAWPAIWKPSGWGSNVPSRVAERKGYFLSKDCRVGGGLKMFKTLRYGAMSLHRSTFREAGGGIATDYITLHNGSIAPVIFAN